MATKNPTNNCLEMFFIKAWKGHWRWSIIIPWDDKQALCRRVGKAGATPWCSSNAVWCGAFEEQQPAAKYDPLQISHHIQRCPRQNKRHFEAQSTWARGEGTRSTCCCPYDLGSTVYSLYSVTALLQSLQEFYLEGISYIKMIQNSVNQEEKVTYPPNHSSSNF